MTLLDPYQSYPQATEPTWGDYWKVFEAGSYQLGAGGAALGRRVTSGDPSSSTYAGWQDYLQSKRDETAQGYTPATQKSLASDFGSEEFWSRPAQWAVLRLLNSAPSLAATIAPMVALRGPAGKAVGGMVGGAVSAGSIYQDIYERVDNSSDEELASTVPAFAKSIADGKTSTQAREDLIQAASDNPALWAFASGALGSMVGPEAAVAGAAKRLLGEEVTSRVSGGVIKGALKEAGIGVATEGPQEAFEQYQQERAGVAAGLQPEVDWSRVKQSGYAGAVIGGIMGAPAGAVSSFGHGGAKPSTDAPPADVRAKTEPFAQKAAIPDTTPPPSGGPPSPTPGPIQGLTPTGGVGAIPVTPVTPRPAGTPDPNAPPIGRVPGDFKGPIQQPPVPGPQPDPNAPAPVRPPTPGLVPDYNTRDTLTPDTVGALTSLGREDNFIFQSPDALTPPPEQMAALQAQAPTAVPPPPSAAVGVQPQPTPAGPPSTGPAGAIPTERDFTLPAELPATVRAAPPEAPAPAAPGPGPAPVPAAPGPGPAPVPAAPGPTGRPTGRLGLKAPVGPRAAPPSAGTREVAPRAPEDFTARWEWPPGPDDVMRVARENADTPITYASAVKIAEERGWRGPYSARVEGRMHSKGWKPPAVGPQPGVSEEPPAPGKTGEVFTPRSQMTEGERKVYKVEQAKEVARRRAAEWTEKPIREDVVSKTKKEPEPEAAPEPAEPRNVYKGKRILEAKRVPIQEGESELAGYPGFSSAARRRQKLGTKAAEVIGRNIERMKHQIEEKAKAQRHAEEGIKPGAQPTGKIGKDAKAQRDDGNKIALDLLSRQPAHIQPVDTPAKRQKLFDRLQTTMTNAENRGVIVGQRVTEKTPDGQAYLITAKELVNEERFSEKGATAQHIATFLANENAAHKGDFSLIRSGRKAEFSQQVGASLQQTILNPEQALEVRQMIGEQTKEMSEEAGMPVAAEEEAVAGEEEVRETELAEPEHMEEADVVETTKVGSKAAGRPELFKPPPKAAHPKAEAAKAVAKTRQAKLRAAVKEIDAKATEAQREAEVAPAGHFAMDGLRLTVTHKKGQERNGVPAPDPYGYIRGTEAPDGDHVDAWFGPDMDKAYKVYVIHQEHLDTKTYDEPKAMLGYADVKAATDTYRASFADGKGLERIRDVEVMTVPEFKKWVMDRTNTTKAPDQVVLNVRKAGSVYNVVSQTNKKVLPVSYPTREQAIQAAARHADENPGVTLHQNIAPPPASMAAEKTGGRRWGGFASPEAFLIAHGYEPTTVGELDFNQMLADAGYEASMRAHPTAFWNQLNKFAKDVPVYRISSEHMRLMEPNGSAGNYYGVDNLITLDEDYLRMNPQIALHEVVHAAFLKTMIERPEIRRTVDMIAREFAASRARKGYERKGYEFTNSDEFIAEVFSKGYLRNALMYVQASSQLRGIMQARRGSSIVSAAMSLWDALRQTVAHAFNFKGRTHNSLLDAVMHVGQMLEETTPAQEPISNIQAFQRMAQLEHERRLPGSPWTGMPTDLSAIPAMRDTFRAPEQLDQEGKPLLVHYRGSDSLAQKAKDYGENHAKQARRLVNSVERQRVRSQQIAKESDPYLNALNDASKKYRGPQFDRYAAFEHDATVAQMDPSKPLDGQLRDSVENAWSREQYGDLRERYMALPDDLKILYKNSLQHYTEQQNKLQKLQLNRILELNGHNDPALEQRLFDGKATDADKAALGPELYDQLHDTQELSRLNAYTPQMRHGDHVVHGDFEIKSPPNAIRQLVDDDGSPLPIWEFNTEQEAKNFAKRQPTYARGRVVNVDNAGNLVSKTTEGAETRYRVSVQNRIVEFFETEEEANISALRYQNEGVNVKYAGKKRFDPNNIQTEMLSLQMRRMIRGLQNRPAYQNLSQIQRNEVMRGLIEQATRLLGSTRIQSRRMPRYNVAGASLDLVRNASVYVKSMSGYMSKLENQPETDDAIAKLEESVTDPSNSGKVQWNARRTIANELIERATSADQFDPRQSKVFNHIAAVAFTRFLASPAYTAIQLLQPTMLTLPRLAARYGTGRAVRMMLRVYSDISAQSILKQGLFETGRQMKGAEDYSFFDSVNKLLSGNEKKAMEELFNLGVFGPDAGMEVERGIALRGKPRRPGIRSMMEQAETGVSRATDWANGVARALPKSAETINRFVSALGAYRLEMERTGGNHDASVLFAQEVTNATQGLYSHTDAPPMFKHPLMKFALLFRRYASLVYDNLGLQLGRAWKNANPGDRAEALKTIGMTLGSHALMAGVLGLPTEPIKIAVTVMAFLGVPISWSDVENKEREIAARVFGKFGGEVFSHGIPRLAGFDLTSRVGLGDMLLSPREPNPDDQQSVNAMIGELVGGAPWSMIQDTFKGVRQMAGGDVVAGAQRAVPIKAVQDAIRAWQTTYEGKKTPAGYVALTPYDPVEAMYRTLGLTPAREAEASERRQYFYQQKTQDDAERNNFMHDYLTAKPSERFRIWRSVQDWNRGQPSDRRLSMKDLEAYRKRRATEEVEEGFRIDKTSRDLFKRTKDVYNVQ